MQFNKKKLFYTFALYEYEIALRTF